MGEAGSAGEAEFHELLRVAVRHEGLTFRERLTILPRSWWASRPSAWELRHPETVLAAHRLCTELRSNSYTMLEMRRGRTLHALGREIERRNVCGSIVECGVWNGGSGVLMSSGAPSRAVWLFDSFEGMPHPTEPDGDEASQWIGVAQGSIERVRECFARYDCDAAPLHIVKGWFEDTLADAAPSVGPVALLHLDADWYESIQLAMDSFYPLVVPGGFIAVDDYGHAGFPGVKVAVDEFRARVGDRAELVDSHFWRKLS